LLSVSYQKPGAYTPCPSAKTAVFPIFLI
jgi:hypothetical protein